MRFVLQPSDADVFVTDEAGRDVYWVEGPRGGVGRWTLRDLAGAELATVRQHGLPFLPRYPVSRGGRPLAQIREQPPRGVPRAALAVRNALLGAPPRARYGVDVVGAAPLRVDGDAAALEYAWLRGDRPAATVSARWLAAAATWGVTVAVDDPRDALLVLAATATVEIGWGRMGRPQPQPRVPAAAG